MANLNHLFKKDNDYYIVDGENLSIYKIPKTINDKLDNFSSDELHLYESKMITKPRETFEIVDSNKRSTCRRLIIILSNYCNLACKYCYANGGNYENNNLDNMSLETLKKSIETVLSIYPDGIEYIQFFGGEPLINKNVMVDGIEFINNYFRIKGIKAPKYTIVTNGILIDDDIIEIFNKYFSSVTISLDGEKSINDKSRVFKTNVVESASVYDKVIEKIELINNKKRSFSLSLEITVTPYHIDSFINEGTINSISCLRKLDVDVFQVSPVFHRDNKEYQFSNQESVKLFFDKWVIESFNSLSKKKGKYVNVGNILKAFSKKCYNGNNCGAVKSDIAIDVNGDMYPCFMFIGHEKFKIANSYNFNIEKYNTNRNKIIKELTQANNNIKCSNCWAKKLCSDSYGHCIGARYLLNGSINEPINLACEIGKTVIERTIVKTIDYFGMRK